MATTISYKGSTLATAVNQTKVLNTAGKYMEDDVTIVDTSEGGSAISVTEEIDSTGGTNVIITAVDLSDDTVTADTLLQGYTAHDRSGQAITGTAQGGSVNNQNKSVTPSESQQTVTADSGYTGLGEVTVGAISSSYVGSGIPRKSSSDLTVSGTTVTAPAGYYGSDAEVSVSGGSSKNTQIANGVNRVNTTAYTAVSGQSITVAKTGTYDVYWIGYRSSTSGTNGSQLYIGNTDYGTAQTSFNGTYTNWQLVHLSNVSLTKNDVITVRARARGTGYYMYVANLTIIEA